MDELDYKKKYIKYKNKYLNLLNKNKIKGGDENDNPNKTVPVKPIKNAWLKPISLLTKNTPVLASVATTVQQESTVINDPVVFKTPTKPKQASASIITPIIMTPLTPSKDVNKKELCHVFNDIEILRICTTNNFIGRFVDKPKIHQGQDDECLLELWTQLDPNDILSPDILIGHITVHKGISISRSKTLHYRSDYLTDFLIVITLEYNENGKNFILGENNKYGTVGFNFLKSLPTYTHDLGDRVENIVMKILEYLNTITAQILFNPI